MTDRDLERIRQVIRAEIRAALASGTVPSGIPALGKEEEWNSAQGPSGPTENAMDGESFWRRKGREERAAFEAKRKLASGSAATSKKGSR